MDESKRMDEVRPGVNFLLGLLAGAAVVAIVALIVYIEFDLPVKRGISEIKMERLPQECEALYRLEPVEGVLPRSHRLVLGIPIVGQLKPIVTKLPIQVDGTSFNPLSVTYDGENIWVGARDQGTLAKIRPCDGFVLGTVTLDKNSVRVPDITWDGTRIWAIVEDTIYKVSDGPKPGDYTNICLVIPASISRSPTTEHIIQRLCQVSISHPEADDSIKWGRIAFDGEYIWVAARDQALVVRIHPSDVKSSLRVPITESGSGVADMAVGDKRIWVLVDDQIHQVDASDSGPITSPIAITTPISPTSIAYDGDSLWVGGDEGKVVKFQPDNGSTEDFPLANPEARVVDLAWDGKHIWALDNAGRLSYIGASDEETPSWESAGSLRDSKVDTDSRIFSAGSFIWVTLDGVLYRR